MLGTVQSGVVARAEEACQLRENAKRHGCERAEHKNGEKVDGAAAEGAPSHLPACLQGAAKGDLVGELEVAAHGQA